MGAMYLALSGSSLILLFFGRLLSLLGTAPFLLGIDSFDTHHLAEFQRKESLSDQEGESDTEGESR